MGLTALREKKIIHRQTKLNPAARDDTLRSKDTNDRSVQETQQYLYCFFTSDPPHCPTVLSAFTTASMWRVFLLYGGSQSYKCITATYLSNGPLTLLIEIVDRVSIRGKKKNDINTVEFLAQTDRFMSLDLNVSSPAAGFNLVLSVYVFFLSKLWVPLTAIIWLTDCNGLT